MLPLLQLKLKCPKCNHSLMDDENPINKSSSVSLNIKIKDKESWIRLSSLYGDYTHEIGIDMNPGGTARFYCPHCREELATEVLCDVCNAPMIPLLHEQGGIVKFCSRKGCKNHSVEFKDVEQAAKIFYNKYSWAGEEGIKVKSKKLEKTVEIISSGAYLSTYCPHCQISLVENDTIKLKVKGKDGTQGFLYLDPHLNSFSNKSTIDIPENEVVEDLSCPHCSHSLIDYKDKCKKCHADVAAIKVSAFTKLIDFKFCSRKNCHWHGLSNEDLEMIELDDSDEW